MTEPQRYYRVHDPITEGSGPWVAAHILLRKTPRGAWIISTYNYARLAKPLEERPAAELQADWGARFVLDDDGPRPGHCRRYAYTTLEAAVVSYRIRKRWQIRHAKHAIERAEAALARLTEDNEIIGGGVHETPYIFLA